MKIDFPIKKLFFKCFQCVYVINIIIISPSEMRLLKWLKMACVKIIIEIK